MVNTRPILNYLIIIVLFILSAFQQSNRIGFETIKIWDEAYSARTAIEMLASKNYIVVTDNGNPARWDVKPPLTIWSKVISYKIFGINEFAVRFPTIVSSWLTMLILVLFAIKFLKKPEVAWIILIIIATTRGYMTYHVARHGDNDSLLVLFVTVYFLSYFIVLEKFPEKYYKYLIITGLAVAGAVYTKSIAGLVPLSGLAVFTLFLNKGRKLLTKRFFYLIILSTIILILIYYISREIMDPGYLKAVWRMELGLISYDPTSPYKHPEAGFYLRYLYKFSCRPWIYFIPLIIPTLVFSKNNAIRRLIIYSFTGAAIFLFCISISHTKNEWYASPVYIFVWIMLAVSFYEIAALILSKIKPIVLKIAVLIILFFFPARFAIKTYQQIYQANYVKPGDYIYEPERAGHYLKHIKTRYPDLKNLVTLTQDIPGQLEFYSKKYEFEDSTSVEIIKTINSDLVNKKIFVIDTINQKLLHETYRVTLLDSAQYGRLYQIDSIKDTLPVVPESQ